MSETMYAALEVQTERARNAEAELALIKQKLEAAQRHIKELRDVISFLYKKRLIR